MYQRLTEVVDCLEILLSHISDETLGQLQQGLKDALALVEVRTLDHIIVGGANSVSMAERGLL